MRVLRVVSFHPVARPQVAPSASAMPNVAPANRPPACTESRYGWNREQSARAGAGGRDALDDALDSAAVLAHAAVMARAPATASSGMELRRDRDLGWGRITGRSRRDASGSMAGSRVCA